MPEYILVVKDRKPGEPDPAVLDGNIVGEIVRCKDCRCVTDIDEKANLAWCHISDLAHDLNWFCADGEPKN